MAILLLAVPLLALQASALLQQPLWSVKPDRGRDADPYSPEPGKLHGRFLHITDIHTDFHYKPGSKTNSKKICHRGSGDAGYLGALGTDCDTPLSLVNATFQWIEDNLKDTIDFVVWTGDTVRHDADEKIPRTERELLDLHEFVVNKFLDVFPSDGKGKRLGIPIVPTIGNNDIMPHNIFKNGPNRWTKNLGGLWDKLIPEHQRHTFAEGGWFYVEVIPDKLAVFSLNTMYFFDSNNAVDGCDDKTEPGYEHMEWLRVQLQFIRERDMKAILIGHVPPARAGSKSNWDESCWQKYTLWIRQYRDVVVGSVYGHMNIDHFMFQDFRDLEIDDERSGLGPERTYRSPLEGEISTQSRASYLSSLRAVWSRLPSPPSNSAKTLSDDDMIARSDDFVAGIPEDDSKLSVQKSRKKYLKQIGGPWAERYSLSMVSPSIIPNYFPTLRVIEYNVTGLHNAALWSDIADSEFPTPPQTDNDVDRDDMLRSEKKHKKKKKKGKKGKKGKKKPSFKIPEPPSSTAPPGPAYSNQPLTWLSYTQYFANLTKFEEQASRSADWSRFKESSPSWREYILKKAGIDSSEASKSRKFHYEVEYDTKDDDIYKLRDMTVKSYLKLARRIAKGSKSAIQKFPPSEGTVQASDGRCEDNDAEHGNCLHGESHILSQDSPRERTAKAVNKVWRIFLRRAFTGYIKDDDLEDQSESA